MHPRFLPRFARPLLLMLALSGVALFSAKVYLVVMSIVLVVAVGLSRLYLGVHWPSDMLAGWSVGAAWAIGFSVLARARNPGGGETETP